MWRPRSRFYTLLEELLGLLREANSLQREMIEIQTKRPARTPRSRLAHSPLPPLVERPAPTKPIRQATAADVTIAGQGRVLPESATQLPIPAPERLIEEDLITPTPPALSRTQP